MRSEAERRQAQELIAAGLSDSVVGRTLGIPRSTVRDWRLSGRSPKPVNCPICRVTYFDHKAYSYLLGVYLGDGWLSPMGREAFRFRVSCDVTYPDIINEIATHIVIVRGNDRVGFATRAGCVEVNAYWRHWPCLFPQDGPGRKHERPIQLADWQKDVVQRHSEELLRGLIHTDGSRHLNTVSRKVARGLKEYRYVRYTFTNASEDILGIFTDALDRLEVHWTKTSPRDVSVSRRVDVQVLDRFIGPKS